MGSTYRPKPKQAKPTLASIAMVARGANRGYGDQVFSAELDEDCLATLASRLGVDTADEHTIVSVVEGILSALVNFENAPTPPDMVAYNVGRAAANTILENVTTTAAKKLTSAALDRARRIGGLSKSASVKKGIPLGVHRD